MNLCINKIGTYKYYVDHNILAIDYIIIKIRKTIILMSFSIIFLKTSLNGASDITNYQRNKTFHEVFHKRWVG